MPVNIGRRELIAALGSAVAWPLTARAQGSVQQSRMPRVGVLLPNSLEQQNKESVDAFLRGMRDHGWIDGSNISIELRYANVDPIKAAADAAAFVAGKVDVIVAFSGIPTLAAHQATTTIPIVMDTSNPIELGLVTSLARPGGNVTGLSVMTQEMLAKELELLKEIAPQVDKIGILSNSRAALRVMEELKPAATSLGVSLVPVGFDMEEDLPRHFDEMEVAGVNGYLVIVGERTDPMGKSIAALALQHHLPGVAALRRYADAGLLLSYGVSLPTVHQREAYFVDRILKGAKPADLPVEQPTIFELVINLKTAKALGLTVPPAFLARADEVIE
jgi:putative ABC transport system substrate-binding protein